jgi:hypothetical protein
MSIHVLIKNIECEQIDQQVLNADCWVQINYRGATKQDDKQVRDLEPDYLPNRRAGRLWSGDSLVVGTWRLDLRPDGYQRRWLLEELEGTAGCWWRWRWLALAVGSGDGWWCWTAGPKTWWLPAALAARGIRGQRWLLVALTVAGAGCWQRRLVVVLDGWRTRAGGALEDRRGRLAYWARAWWAFERPNSIKRL